MTVNPMSKRLIFLILLVLGTSLQVSPAAMHAWRLESSELLPSSLPVPARPVDFSNQGDVNQDGQPESLLLFDRQAKILSQGKVVWTSPEAWQVVQAGMTDLDRDGVPEATLLVWRPFSPWPVDRWLPHGGRIQDFHNPQGLSCHLILIGWRKGRYTELWAGSALAEPVLSFAAADLNGDGRQELVTLDGDYSAASPGGSGPARHLKVWEWNGFGFSVVYSLAGTFTGMGIAQNLAGRAFILTP